VSQINPLVSSIAQIPSVQRQQAGAKTGPVRPTRNGRQIASREDTFEPRVENAGEVNVIGDRQREAPKPPIKPKPEKPTAKTDQAARSRLDLMA